MSEYIQPIINWLHLHPYWTAIFAFLVAFLESLAVIGTIVPGSVTLTAIGALIGMGVAPFISTLVFAILGAFAGDALSYWFGHYNHDNLRLLWPFRKHPQWLSKGESFFKRHGGKSIFIGRFVGPIRAILPIVAGMLDMPLKRFLVIDLLSAMVWAPSYILPGILIGTASVELSPEIATRFVLIILIVLLVIFSVSWGIKYALTYGIERINRSLDKTWTYLRTHKPSHFLTTLLQDPSHPEGHGQLTMALALILVSSLFIALALCVKYTTLFTSMNSVVFHVLQSVRTEKLGQWILAITFIGEFKVLSIFLIAITLWLLYQGNKREAVYWLFNGILGMLLVSTVRRIVQSTRPVGLTVPNSGYSFPSGHATLSVLILGFLAVLIAKQLHRDTPKSVIYVPFAGIMILVAFSRVFLGDHWLTDVIGGDLLGLSCVLFSTIALQRKENKPIKLVAFSLVSLLIFTLAWGYYFLTHFEKEVRNHQPYFPITTMSYRSWQEHAKPLLPLYRNARTGKPIETLNIQWVGNVDDIEQYLIKRGWQKVPIPTFMSRIENIFTKDKTRQLPFFDKLYQLQKPSLVMMKSTANDKPILVLRLWASRYKFSDTQLPLWIGNIHYRIIKPLHAEKNYHLLDELPNSLTVLHNDLGNTPHRFVKFSTEGVNSFYPMEKQIDVMLIYR